MVDVSWLQQEADALRCVIDHRHFAYLCLADWLIILFVT